jgi:heme exporter protein B
MLKVSPVRQLAVLVGQGVRAELADKERLVSPVLFGMTMLILFSFAMGEPDPLLKRNFFVAQTFLTAFLALQLSFSRLFEPDRQDRVFDLMRTYPISSMAWFLSKYLLVLLLGAAILVPTILFSAFLYHSDKEPVLAWVVIGIALLALAGLSALGVLLSAMTLKANARQILYPLLYFPLTTPVLLAATNASLTYLEVGEVTENVTTWACLLLAFDVIYFTLGLLLYGELVDDA